MLNGVWVTLEPMRVCTFESSCCTVARWVCSLVFISLRGHFVLLGSLKWIDRPRLALLSHALIGVKSAFVGLARLRF